MLSADIHIDDIVYICYTVKARGYGLCYCEDGPQTGCVPPVGEFPKGEERCLSMTQKERQERSKREILEAAMEEFGTRGYDAVTMEGICGGHGISKGMLYHYYPNKDALPSVLRQYQAGGDLTDMRALMETEGELLDLIFYGVIRPE